ncbi:MAG: ABC transporter ATP-binding protein [Sulfuricella denitrificans]|nr:ABC transporter ATP-binding protein [Sulfuricella denitrificans]
MSSGDQPVSDIPVRIEQVSKGYRFYRQPMDRLRELLFNGVHHQTHWALKDVSISVGRGETFGLIGENGAGKSTLLKLVAGTCGPTTGTVSVEGKVAALLELGAGFHPEESGRDNAYLMGALSGVPPSRMEEYYRSVADFSELSAETLERPVKTYSSGMFMRLAFATATAVDPDVLIIDEALSVGDMHFQKKSLDRTMAFRDKGRTILFCSHNLYQVRSLCNRAAWIHQGQVMAIGNTEEVVTAYESHEREKAARMHVPGSQLAFKPAAVSSAPVRIREVVLLNEDNLISGILDTFQPVSIRVSVESVEVGVPFHVGIALMRNDRENVFGTSTHFEHAATPLTANGERTVELSLPHLNLLSGQYGVAVYVLDDTGLQVYDMAEMICPFTVHSTCREPGMVYIPYIWNLDH